jgi:hypothetical protein
MTEILELLNQFLLARNRAAVLGAHHPCLSTTNMINLYVEKKEMRKSESVQQTKEKARILTAKRSLRR